MVTDEDILQVLECVQEHGNDPSQGDVDSVFAALKWDSDHTNAVLEEAKQRLLVWGWKDFHRGGWRAHLEVTVQGERLLRSARTRTRAVPGADA